MLRRRRQRTNVTRVGARHIRSASLSHAPPPPHAPSEPVEKTLPQLHLFSSPPPPTSALFFAPTRARGQRVVSVCPCRVRERQTHPLTITTPFEKPFRAATTARKQRLLLVRALRVRAGESDVDVSSLEDGKFFFWSHFFLTLCASSPRVYGSLAS